MSSRTFAFQLSYCKFTLRLKQDWGCKEETHLKTGSPAARLSKHCRPDPYANSKGDTPVMCLSLKEIRCPVTAKNSFTTVLGRYLKICEGNLNSRGLRSNFSEPSQCTWPRVQFEREEALRIGSKMGHLPTSSFGRRPRAAKEVTASEVLRDPRKMLEGKAGVHQEGYFFYLLEGTA